MEPPHLYPSVKMAVNQAAHGSILKFSPVFTTHFGGIRLAREVPPMMLALDFLKTSFRPLAASLPRLGKFTSGRTLSSELNYSLQLPPAPLIFFTSNSPNRHRLHLFLTTSIPLTHHTRLSIVYPQSPLVFLCTHNQHYGRKLLY